MTLAYQNKEAQDVEHAPPGNKKIMGLWAQVDSEQGLFSSENVKGKVNKK